MIRDITIGQHFPGSSLVHRFDPRLKLVLTIAYIAVQIGIGIEQLLQAGSMALLGGGALLALLLNLLSYRLCLFIYTRKHT